MRKRAVNYLLSLLPVSDWQELETALADHDEFGPWLEVNGGIAAAQSVIREAEKAAINHKRDLGY